MCIREWVLYRVDIYSTYTDTHTDGAAPAPEPRSSLSLGSAAQAFFWDQQPKPFCILGSAAQPRALPAAAEGSARRAGSVAHLPLTPLLGSIPVPREAWHGHGGVWDVLDWVRVGWNVPRQRGMAAEAEKADVCAIFRKLKIVPPTKRNWKNNYKRISPNPRRFLQEYWELVQSKS